MATYYAKDGQTFEDVCMNTYGSLDYMFKLLSDNGLNTARSSANNLEPITGQAFTWDDTLIVDISVYASTTFINKVYATKDVGVTF